MALFSHSVQGDVPVYPDTKVTLAFGDEVFPVLVDNLATSSSVEVLASSLRAANRLLPTALNAVKAVAAGIVPQLARLVHHADISVRLKAVQSLGIMFVHPSARADFIDGGHLEGYRAVLADADLDVKLAALRSLDTLGSAAPGGDSMQRHGYVRVLIDLARLHDVVDVKAGALRALSRCVNVGSPGQREAVDSPGTIPVLLELFGPTYGGKVREEAAHILCLLCFLDEGKAAAVAAGAAPALCAIMADRSAGVKAEAVAACMAMAVANEAKEAFLAAGLQPIFKLLSDPSPLVRMNTLRAVSTLCANPAVRTAFRSLGALEAIRGLLASPDKREADIAAKAFAIVEWRA